MLLVQHYGPKGRLRQKQGRTRPDDKARFAAFRQLAERFFAPGRPTGIHEKNRAAHPAARERHPGAASKRAPLPGQQQHERPRRRPFFGQFHIYGCLAASGHAEQQVRRGIPGIKIRTERSQRRPPALRKARKGLPMREATGCSRFPLPHNRLRGIAGQSNRS